MKSKGIFISIFIILILSGCKETNISQLPQNDLKFEDLPLDIQGTYVRTFGNDIWFDNFIVNLDSNKTKIEYENTGKAGVRPGKKIFTIDGSDFIMPWNANAEAPPFILSDKKFYYRYTPSQEDMNPSDTNDIKKSKYRMINLTEFLKY